MKITNQNIEKINAFYKDNLKKYDINDERALGWSNNNDQVIRFNVLTSIANLNNKSVLDVGCGLADLSAYLLKSFSNIKYEGIDIVDEMVLKASRKYPGVNVSTKMLDEFNDGSFDCVFSSGAMSLTISDNIGVYTDMIKNMYRVSRKGVAFNMLMNGRHINDDTYYTYDPKEISDLCSGFAENIEVVIGYLPEDFTIYLMH